MSYKSHNTLNSPISPITPTPKKAGYEYLLAYKITIPIYDYTLELCHRARSPDIPNFPELSSTRTFDQMIQAARSGMTNIPEGFKEKSLSSYIYLVGVAGGSLEELLKDFYSYARQNKIEIWTRERSVREIRELREIWEILRYYPYLPDNPDFPNFPDNPITALNLLITLTKQATYLIGKLGKSLEEKHQREGGFRENLLRKRLEYKKRN